jgi:hypothetical protein
LFGEGSGTAWITARGEDADALIAAGAAAGVPVDRVGIVHGDRLVVSGLIDIALADLATAHSRRTA